MQAVERAGYEVRPAAPVELAVAGLTCASCVGRVEKSLRGVAGVWVWVWVWVWGASVNLATERATVNGNADPATLIAAVSRAGYDARLIADDSPPTPRPSDAPPKPAYFAVT